MGGDIDDDDYTGGQIVSLNNDGLMVANVFSGDARIYVYSYRALEWIQMGGVIDGGVHSINLSSDGSVVAIGDAQSKINGDYSGKIMVFTYSNTALAWF
eukprot:scaffold2946_cov278-Chaetoceros_neogracile.AAC.13